MYDLFDDDKPFELQWFIMIIYKLNRNFRWTEDGVIKLQYTTYGVSLRPLPTSPLGRGFESAKEKVLKAKEQKCEHVMAKHEGKSVKVKEQYYYPSFAFHTTTFVLLSLCLLITDNLMEVSKSP